MSSAIKPYISYLDKSFSESQTQSYILSLQLSLHGLVLSVYHPETNKYIALQAFRFEGSVKPIELASCIDLIQKDVPWLYSPFQSVNFIYGSNQSTLIPNALFDETKSELYLQFNQPVNENSQIEFNNLKSIQAVNIFSVPVNVYETIIKNWPESRFFHSSSVLIESLAINFKNKTDNNTLFVNFMEDSFEVVYFKDNRLHFYNAFRFNTTEDFIYFLLSVLEQLALNPEDAKVILIGDIDKSKQNYDMIFRYIRHSEFIERNDTFRYSHVMDEIMPHNYYTLFNALQCES